MVVASWRRAHVKMVLTGEGGDELFAGYARYAGERLSPLFALLAGRRRARPRRSLRRARSRAAAPEARALRALPADEARASRTGSRSFNPEMKAALLSR